MSCFVFRVLAEGDDEVVHGVPNFLVEFRVFSTECADGLAVVDPEHGSVGEAHEVEDTCPDHAEFSARSGHSVFVEGDVAGFITDDEAAHLGEGMVF